MTKHQRHIYVLALQHCALLLASADRDARAAKTGRTHPDFSADEYRDSAAALVHEANKISIKYFGRFASDLI